MEGSYIASFGEGKAKEKYEKLSLDKSCQRDGTKKGVNITSGATDAALGLEGGSQMLSHSV